MFNLNNILLKYVKKKKKKKNLPIKVNMVSSSLPPGLIYLVLKTKSFPCSSFFNIEFKYLGSKDPSALKIQE